MLLPKAYQWLEKETSPKILLQMLALYGTKEAPGSADNPTILAWAKETKLDTVYKHDQTSWCGLAMALAVQRAGYQVVEAPLWALNWAKFGVAVKEPMLGDLLVFRRFDRLGKLIGGHIALYVGEDTEYYHCLGGNQADSVNILRIAKKRLYQARRPTYTITPASVRKIVLQATGQVSENEA